MSVFSKSKSTSLRLGLEGGGHNCDNLYDYHRLFIVLNVVPRSTGNTNGETEN